MDRIITSVECIRQFQLEFVKELDQSFQASSVELVQLTVPTCFLLLL